MYMFIYSQELKLVFGYVLNKVLTAMNFQILGVCAGLYTQFLYYVLWDTSGSHFHLVLVDEEIAPGWVEPLAVLVYQDGLGVVVRLLTDLIILLYFILSKTGKVGIL